MDEKLKADVAEDNKKVAALKAVYTKCYKEKLENDPEADGYFIVIYKDQLWCETDKCESFRHALLMFQDKVESVDEQFYITRVGHSDPPPLF